MTIKTVFLKTRLIVLTVMLTIFLSISAQNIYACTNGTKPCGEICIPNEQTCNIKTKDGTQQSKSWTDVLIGVLLASGIFGAVGVVISKKRD